MTASDHNRLTKFWDAKAYDAGAGMWFHKTDRTEQFVEATLYPEIKLWIFKGKSRREISIEELRRDYERLAL